MFIPDVGLEHKSIDNVIGEIIKREIHAWIFFWYTLLTSEAPDTTWPAPDSW